MFKKEQGVLSTPPLTKVIRIFDEFIFKPPIQRQLEEHSATASNLSGNGGPGLRPGEGGTLSPGGNLEVEADSVTEMETDNDDDGDSSSNFTAMGAEDCDDSSSILTESEKEDTPDTKLYARLGDVHEVSTEGRKNIKVYCDAGGDGVLQITFHRTIRVPDNGLPYELPPDLGEFPIYSVRDYEKNLPKQITARGGAFIPMYQREAMWMSFDADRPFAIKVHVGGVNAISGEPQIESLTTTARRLQMKRSKKSIQDYLVAGPTTQHQDWLDGIVNKDGSVAQFVAMPLDSGHTIEGQIITHESVGSVQIEVLPIKYKYCMKLKVTILTGSVTWIDVTPNTTIRQIEEILSHLKSIPLNNARLVHNSIFLELDRTLASYNIQNLATIHLVPGLGGDGGPQTTVQTEEKDGTTEMGITIGDGIKQVIRKDFHPADIWDQEQIITFNIQILNAFAFPMITALPAPSTPINTSTYDRFGYPFYSVYNEPTGIAGQFEGVETAVQEYSTGSMKSELDEEDEQHLGFPTIILDKNHNPAGFRPVAQMEAELEKFCGTAQGRQLTIQLAATDDVA